MKIKSNRFFGAVIIVAILVVGFYGIYKATTENKIDKSYTETDRIRLYNDCYYYGKVSKYYPVIADRNCQCITDSRMKRYSKEQLAALENMNDSERDAKIMDIALYCAHKSGRDTVKVLNRK
jgi:hypothetical protein